MTFQKKTIRKTHLFQIINVSSTKSNCQKNLGIINILFLMVKCIIYSG